MKNSINRRFFLKNKGILFANLLVGLPQLKLKRHFVIEYGRLDTSYPSIPAFDQQRSQVENTAVIEKIISKYLQSGEMVHRERKHVVQDGALAIKWMYEFVSEDAAKKWEDEVHEKMPQIWTHQDLHQQHKMYEASELVFTVKRYPVFSLA